MPGHDHFCRERAVAQPVMGERPRHPAETPGNGASVKPGAFHTRAYVERRTAEGLSKPEIMRCLKRYLAREVYHALRTDLRAIAGVDSI